MDIFNEYGNTFQLAELARVLEIDESVIAHFNGIPNEDILRLTDDGRIELESGYTRDDNGINAAYWLELKSPLSFDARTLLTIPGSNKHAFILIAYAKRMLQVWLHQQGIDTVDTSFDICRYTIPIPLDLISTQNNTRHVK